GSADTSLPYRPGSTPSAFSPRGREPVVHRERDPPPSFLAGIAPPAAGPGAHSLRRAHWKKRCGRAFRQPFRMRADAAQKKNRCATDTFGRAIEEPSQMRIAQVAPLMESVPPRLYGGTERIVSYLTEELVRLGHDVTLFASGDSITAADLVGCAPMALRLESKVRDPIPYYMLMLDRVRQRAGEFDIIHFHIDQFQFPIFRPLAGRTVTTLHVRQDLPDLKPLYLGFDDMPLVSISNAQRGPVANANFVKTVSHGIPEDLHPLVVHPRGGYVAFLGRIAAEKRPDRA